MSIHPTACIHNSAEIHNEATIGRNRYFVYLTVSDLRGHLLNSDPARVVARGDEIHKEGDHGDEDQQVYETILIPRRTHPCASSQITPRSDSSSGATCQDYTRNLAKMEVPVGVKAIQLEIYWCTSAPSWRLA
jgi:hypothetical protein